MTAFMLAVKPKSSPSDKTPLTIESLIAVPKRTTDGRRITVQKGKVTVENRMTQFLLAEIIVGNLMTILWLSMEFEFNWIEYFSPLVHTLFFIFMMKASIEKMNVLLVLTVGTLETSSDIVPSCSSPTAFSSQNSSLNASS